MSLIIAAYLLLFLHFKDAGLSLEAELKLKCSAYEKLVDERMSKICQGIELTVHQTFKARTQLTTNILSVVIDFRETLMKTY